MFSNKANLYGAVVLQQLQYDTNKYIYIVGEQHSTEGACAPPQPSTQVIHHIVDYAKQHPHEKVMMIYEGAAATYTYPASNRPPSQYINRLIIDRTNPPNMTIAFGDCRHMYPYDLFSTIYHLDVFVALRFHTHVDECIKKGIYPMENKDFYDTWHRKAKQLEKLVFKHIATRKKMNNFIKSLLLPDRPFPNWYLECYGETSQHSLTKMLLADIKTINPEYYYDSIVKYIDEQLRLFLDTNHFYSPVMNLVNVHRKSKSPNMEFNKVQHADLKKFFIVLYSFLQDVHVLAHCYMSAVKSNWDHYVIVVSAAHAQNLSRVFQETATSSWYATDLKHACINTHTPDKKLNSAINVEALATHDMSRVFETKIYHMFNP
jgi:hypothetical protein